MASSTQAVPRIAVVCATYNRSELLPRLFASLERQTLASSEFEVVIVDDCSSDSTRSVLADLAANTPLRTLVLHQEANRGPAAARNRGLAAASADVIAFTDDDCVPSPGWLAAGLAELRPGRIIVGRTEPAPDQERGPFSRTVRVTDARFMQTCNVFYEKELLVETGGFDERFRGAAGEDTELGLRLIRTGASAHFAEAALVHHDVRPSSFRASLREALRKWTDLPLVIRLHPSARERLILRVFWRRSHAFGVLAFFSMGLATAAPILVVGLAPWIAHHLVAGRDGRHVGRQLQLLPARLVLDIAEVLCLSRGSIRHRTVML